MPYIAKTDQERFTALTDVIAVQEINSAGELNFLLTTLIIRYMEVHGTRYQFMNDVVGALDGAKAEFQRRVVNPYEYQKAFDVSLEDADPYSSLTS